MKQIILILTFAILFKPVWPLVEYIVNYDYIVENLCENRSKPMLNCNGKCYLAKILAEESKEEEKNPFNSVSSKFETPIINWNVALKLALKFDISAGESNYEWNTSLLGRLLTIDILHPPRA